MLVLLLLVGLFIAGMWLISGLNLNFAQQAMTEQRQRQIADTFHSNLARINTHHLLMERNTAALARMGERLVRQKSRADPADQVELERSIHAILTDVPDLHGGSILFHPGSYRPDAFAVHAIREHAALQINSQSADFALQSWYQDLHTLLRPHDQPSRPFHWSAAYYKPEIENVVISIITPLQDERKRFSGLAVIEWRADEIIRLVSGVRVTPGTFAFLLDRENRNLSSLAEASNEPQAQRLMDIIIDLQLQQPDQVSALPAELLSRYPASPMQHRIIEVDNADYALFHAPTDAGLIFGIGIPQAEIDAVLAPMRASNLRIVVGIVSIMLLLSGIILYLVASTLKQLNSLYTDALTGLPNREKLLLDLRKDRPATLILLNIDAFREINDFYGSACGDHVIREIAAGLLTYLAHTSPAGETCLYHMHADEMAILLPLPEHPACFNQWLNALHGCISSLSVHWEGQVIPLQATLGLAATEQIDATPLSNDQLLPSANIAVKMARLQKLNYLIHDPSHGLRKAYEQNLLWANRLRVALEENRIVPWFQPILNLRSGHVDKYECLVRMLDESGESVSPATFLPVARKIRLYRLITRSMVDQCFARFADSTQQFSLNLSCDDLLDEELSEYILGRLQQRSLAERVIFEILESEGIENYRQVRAFIDRAKALGCQIAIDDFGTGYSNFEHLMRLDVDLIKIDGSLIKRLHRDPTARVLTEGIVRFAKELGLQTVAEFVHNEAVLQQVKDLQIDFAQGAHIGMPSPTPTATGLYSADHRG
ncbi:MAG: EAL domain-containing protein [Pseudomonas sp.]